MRSYIPNTKAERQQMLEAIGLSTIDDLFSAIPDNARNIFPLNLPKGMSEIEVRRAFRNYKDQAGELPLFRGAGAYRHYIPAVVNAVTSRSEFYTAYTPYQAEMSQGMLQAIFEYQSLICQLTGMDVSNASVYDGATACAEAMIMMKNSKRKAKVLVSAGLHPQMQQVLATYARFTRVEIVTVPLTRDGVTDLAFLAANMDGAAGAFVASPNFYGCVEDLTAAAEAVHGAKGLLTTVVNPISLGLLKRPGDCGADIAVGEGQPLGMPLCVGGPYLGFMASTKALMRNLPGRIVGQTQDDDGNRTFVLTLQAREQHIRREKASSNICSNESLCAIAAAVYLAAMGPQGMKEVATLNLQRAHYLKEGLCAIGHVQMRYPDAPFFNEFTVDCKTDVAKLNQALLEAGFVGGLPLSRFNADDTTGVLLCATEMNPRTEIDAFLNAWEVAAK